MAERHFAPDVPELRERWAGFVWDSAHSARVAEILARYPEGRTQSAVIPLLDLAQRQVGEETGTQGWLPIPVIEFVAAQCRMAPVRALEVASFYTMYNLVPVGKHHIQLCGTTPCLLRGSDDVLLACEKRGIKKGHTTPDGLFTLTEVECLGACANAPMVQINDDNFEDLTEEKMGAIIDALVAGRPVKAGSQIGRQTSCSQGGPTNLKKMTERNYDYRPMWAEAAGESA